MKITPEFDLKTLTWFVAEPEGIDCEAKTIRELINKLRLSTNEKIVIDNYNPLGTTPKKEKPKSTAPIPRPSTELPDPIVPGKQRLKRKRFSRSAQDPKTRKTRNIERNNQILNMWSEDKYTTDEIARFFRIDRGIVAGVIYRARKRGDSRALPRR